MVSECQGWRWCKWYDCCGWRWPCYVRELQRLEVVTDFPRTVGTKEITETGIQHKLQSREKVRDTKFLGWRRLFDLIVSWHQVLYSVPEEFFDFSFFGDVGDFVGDVSVSASSLKPCSISESSLTVLAAPTCKMRNSLYVWSALNPCISSPGILSLFNGGLHEIIGLSVSISVKDCVSWPERAPTKNSWHEKQSAYSK